MTLFEASGRVKIITIPNTLYRAQLTRLGAGEGAVVGVHKRLIDDRIFVGRKLAKSIIVETNNE